MNATSAPAVAPTPPPPRGLFENLSREHGFEPVSVEGALPSWLSGTLYRNGVGQMEQFGRRYTHVFEADGAISALRLHQGQASAAVRLVNSEGLQEERRAGRHLGSSAAGWLTRLRRIHTGRLKNTANTHVLRWQGRLFALMEGGLPTELDPDTLETLGPTDLDGVVQGTFSAHPHRVVGRKTVYNFGFSYGRQTLLNLYVLPDKGPARCLARLPLDHPVMMHDFIATRSHLVFFVCPIRLATWRMLLALGHFADAFRWTPEAGTEVIVVPIDAPERTLRFTTDPFCCFHFAGAMERGSEILVDYVRYPDSQMMTALKDGRHLTWTDRSSHQHGVLHRARIHLGLHQLISEPLWGGHCEFPRQDPRTEGEPGQSLWLQSATYEGDLMRSQITRLSPGTGEVVHHRPPPGHYASEPVLAPAPDADGQAGVVLSLVYDSFKATSHVLVLDAVSLEPLARIPLGQTIPLTFHGIWDPTPPPPLAPSRLGGFS